MKPDEFQKAYAKLVAAAWADESVKQRLIESPKQVLKEYGVEMPEGIDIRVFENSDNIVNLVIPMKPADIVMDSVETREAAFGCMTPIF